MREQVHTARIILRLPPADLRIVKRTAKSNRQHVSEWVREAITEKLARKRKGRN